MDEFIAGSISGMAQTIVGYPLDTLKILRQNDIPYSIRTFHLKEYFRGISYPMGFSIIINSFKYNPHVISTSIFDSDNRNFII